MKKEEVQKLARLARIEVSDDEVESLLGDLNNILSYVESIKEVNASLEKVAPEHRNIMRDDDDPHERGAFTNELLEGMPDSEESYLRVKKIL